jgi:predicted O-linked N-acetylglucosamine transferase (SPINDLY family)
MKVVDLHEAFPKITWRTIPQGTHPQEFKAIIANDKIDILFDLAGHTGKNRLDTFALKPAPITVTYCGYPNTTGLANIDYRIVDKYCDSDGVSPGPGGVVRPSTQKYHSEKLLFMDRCFLSYTPFPDINKIPELHEQPALKNKYLTLGTFNRYNKITDKVVELWQKILYKCPNVRIILKAKEFNTDYIKQKFLDSWKDKTLLHRVNILPYADTYNEHMPDYNKIDIGLDTFPYSGTTTSCEALIMGVPILTLFDSDRQYHVQNVTSSLMINSELPEYVCLTEDEYLEKVEYYSNHLEELRGLKTTVRDKFMKNICDYPRFVSEFEDKMLHIYKTHEW